MGKILHIIRDFGINNGGSAVMLRNAKILKDIFKSNYIQYSVNNKSSTKKIEFLWGFFKGYFTGLTQDDVTIILNIIDDKNIKYCFIDSSNLGILSKIIKKRRSDIKIFTFFHNCEKALINQTYSGIKKVLYLILSGLNEKLACNYSSHIICLNNRDKKCILKEYNREADFEVPVSLCDKYVYHNEESENAILFVGSYFLPNIEGIKWFISNVFPEIPYRLWIVGNGMSRLNYLKSDKIDIYSNVDDISTFYNRAKFVIMPIFSGSGMKVKTAEALMYGKYIISSPEGVEGYQIPSDGVAICNTKEEFIYSILNYKFKSSFSPINRECFLLKYSDEAVRKAFISLFKSERY